MLECDDTPLSTSVPVRSFDYNLSAADYSLSQSKALSAHTPTADYDDFFQIAIILAYNQ